MANFQNDQFNNTLLYSRSDENDLDTISDSDFSSKSDLGFPRYKLPDSSECFLTFTNMDGRTKYVLNLNIFIFGMF